MTQNTSVPGTIVIPQGNLTGDELLSLYTGGSSDVLTRVSTVSAKGEPITSQGNTTYTLKASDAGSYILFTNNSSVTVTIPSGILGVSDVVTMEQNGNGTITISAAGNVTVNSSGAKVATNGRFAVVSIKKVSAPDIFTLFGNLA